MQRIRIRYAKRGPLRFTSHRDFARAFERALRRAGAPIAFSQGFTPHPKISYASAAPTGVASEAEYLEIGLQAPVDPEELRRALDAALPPGLDVLDAVEAHGGNLAERVDTSLWRVELPGVDPDDLRSAVDRFLGAAEVPVQRMTKQGMRTFDPRGAVVSMSVRNGQDAPTVLDTSAPAEVSADGCAILELVVRLASPTVRPDDVLSGLRVVAALEPPAPARAIRLAQGTLTARGEFVDPLDADRDGSRAGTLTGTPPVEAG
ncbi:MAG TPA: TIGR03936 family radical SAM-associated protein [Micromonosporaceae bacterium]|nr:TIGR03936 family radical SAM-associated protein [Micromonosporaceae bacterium]